MSRNNKGGGKLAPFVAIFRHTIKAPAWRSLSVGARATFIALKSNYNTKAQNAVYLSARDGAKEFGVSKDTVCRWLHELEHYGFIVMVQGAHLGVTGTGKAAHYRLTDCWHAGKPPTYDFQSWDGVLFAPKKQNPVPPSRTPRPSGRDISAGAKMTKNGNNRPTGRDIRNDTGCPTERDITSLTSSLRFSSDLEAPKKWSTPTVEERPWSDYWARYGEMVREAA
jgi:hypothetical protein